MALKIKCAVIKIFGCARTQQKVVPYKEIGIHLVTPKRKYEEKIENLVNKGKTLFKKIVQMKILYVKLCPTTDFSAYLLTYIV